MKKFKFFFQRYLDLIVKFRLKAMSFKLPKVWRQRKIPDPITFQLIQDARANGNYFDRLREDLLSRNQYLARSSPSGQTLICEYGYIGPSQKYFYFKPRGEPGWLFEQSPTGWIVSRSEKIVGKDTFLRKGDPFDKVSLYKPTSILSKPRVASLAMGEELVSFNAYTHLLWKAMSPRGRADGDLL